MVNATLEIETTRDIAHQIVRHRSFAFQEFSQRYADPAEQGDIFEYSEARLQDTKNRQNSISTDDRDLQLWWDMQQKHVAEVAKTIYENAIEKGIAKEQARKVLPEGLTKTRLYMNGTIRSWIHYIDLRSANGTQKEHMEIAVQCAKVIAEIFPMANGLSEL
jgi:thymidylate synthase (FAD)